MPAMVRIGDGARVQPCRVIVDDDGRAVVLGEANGRAEVLARARVEVERERGRAWSLTTADGEVWAVTSGGGCGCGSPLKRLDAGSVLAAGSYE